MNSRLHENKIIFLLKNQLIFFSEKQRLLLFVKTICYIACDFHKSTIQILNIEGWNLFWNCSFVTQ